jgi:hypothetical protein
MTSIPFGYILTTVESTSKAFRILRNSPPRLLLSSPPIQKEPLGGFCIGGPLGLSAPRCMPHKGILWTLGK